MSKTDWSPVQKLWENSDFILFREASPVGTESLLDSCPQNHRHNWSKELPAAVSRCIEEIDNVLDGPVSLIIGSFKFALGPMVGVWLVVKATVSKWTAQTLVEE
jgi:hypothetical protein